MPNEEKDTLHSEALIKYTKQSIFADVQSKIPVIHLDVKSQL